MGDGVVYGLYSRSAFFSFLEVYMATPPQPAPLGPGPAPPPPPELCTECVGPGGNHYITTIAGCKADGGTPIGEPFACTESEARRQQLAERQNAG